MSDIIHLLPDSVANQIAAGEVIQRPASAVKELMENAIDAGAKSIKVTLKDAGKTLIQIIDDGKGMTETDARMCFERHATSKLSKAEDLFAIRTMGFRGEAMASIAAIAQVEMRSKTKDAQVGTLIEIEGSNIIRQEAAACPDGTLIAVKNLFFNIPARRNFLKSNSVELRHIIDEFQRQALAHPEIFFSLHHDGNELFHLPAGNLKQRIIAIFGNNFNERLVPLEESTDIIRIEGFIGKPQFAKKTRGEQYFFVNKRFIKDPYLNHAIMNAYEELLNDDSFPFYVLYIEMDPASIDVNVHPTKTEIKFLDEKFVYAVLRSSVKRSLGKYHIAPTIDFDTESSFGNLRPFDPKKDEIRIPSIAVNPDFNPFKSNSSRLRPSNQFDKAAQDTHTYFELNAPAEQDQMRILPQERSEEQSIQERQTYQLHDRYILSSIKNGILMIDQQAAHERILYERFIDKLEQSQGASQQCLFPVQIHLPGSDYMLIKELWDDLHQMGFDLSEFGKNTLVVNGVPAEIEGRNEEHIIQGILENFKQQQSLSTFEKRDQLAKALAKQASVKTGKKLTKEEMNLLIDELFACKMPQAAINGKATLIRLTLEELSKRFDKTS